MPRLIAHLDAADVGVEASLDAVSRAYRVSPREWNSVLSHIDILRRFADSAGRSEIAGCLKSLGRKLSKET